MSYEFAPFHDKLHGNHFETSKPMCVVLWWAWISFLCLREWLQAASFRAVALAQQNIISTCLGNMC